MSRILFLEVIAVLAIAGVAPAQEFQKPGPEHTVLHQLVGDWDAVFEMQGQKSKATASYKSICAGMWLASDFHGEVAGIKFEGHALDGYDLTKKKHVGVWVDSMSSAPMYSQGGFDADGKLLVMTGESTNPAGKTEKFKTTTELKDKDHFTFKMYMIKPDGTESLSFTIDYTRRK